MLREKKKPQIVTKLTGCRTLWGWTLIGTLRSCESGGELAKFYFGDHRPPNIGSFVMLLLWRDP